MYEPTPPSNLPAYAEADGYLAPEEGDRATSSLADRAHLPAYPPTNKGQLGDPHGAPRHRRAGGLRDAARSGAAHPTQAGGHRRRGGDRPSHAPRSAGREPAE